MMELITDRAAADVKRLEQLTAKGWDDLTVLERMEWLHGRDTIPLRWSDGEALTCADGPLRVFPDVLSNKGAYNCTDLNRVTEALEALDALLASYGYVTGYAPILIHHGQEDRDPRRWYEEDHMTPAQTERFLGNVLSVYSAILTAPELPETITKLDYSGANQIERALLAVSEAVEKIVAGFVRSGSFAFWSGNRPIPTAKSDLGRTWAELDDMHTTWRNWQAASWYLLLYGNLEAEGDVV